MKTISVREARAQFSDTINRVAYAGERVLLERNGKSSGAAIVPASDLALLERLEDILDDLEADETLDDALIPWPEVKKRLGL